MGNKHQKNKFGFNGYSKIEDLLLGKDLENKHFFITGCNRSIGYEIVKNFYKANAKITMACRNEESMKKAKEEITSNIKSKGSIFCVVLDLNSLKSIKNCVSKIIENPIKIDGLINNAAVRCVRKSKTEDGFDKHMGINFLGHVYLTKLLFPFFTENCRIINVGSNVHSFGTIDFNDFQYEKRRYIAFKSYGSSKLSIILFSREFNRRLKENNKKITCFSCHPGFISTEMSKDSDYFKIRKVMNLFGGKVEQGAAGITFPLLYDMESSTDFCEKYGGTYFVNCGDSDRISKTAKDDDLAKKLFEYAEKLLGIKFFNEELE